MDQLLENFSLISLYGPIFWAGVPKGAMTYEPIPFDSFSSFLHPFRSPKALPAATKALPAASVVLPAAFEALPAVSKASSATSEAFAATS